MSNAFVYGVQALAHAGFAVLAGPIAAAARPDLWTDGLTCAGEIGQRRTRERLAAMPGVTAVRVRLAGLPEPVEVLTRSTARLAERIEEVTGRRCELVLPDEKPRASAWASRQMTGASDEPVAAGAAAPSPSPMPRPPTGDMHEGMVTANPGLTCSECANFTAAHECAAVGESGIKHPNPRTPRRCIAFAAPFESTLVLRTGKAIWPELMRA